MFASEAELKKTKSVWNISANDVVSIRKVMKCPASKSCRRKTKKVYQNAV